MARAVPLFSGSKGNSYYIGSATEGVLIDAGRSCKQIENAMLANGIDMSSIGAVFITHEHTDHCSALRVLAKRYGFKVYSSLGTLNALRAGNKLDPNTDADVITDEVVIGNMRVQRFDTPHDAAESCCYRVTAPDGKSALIATDMGVMLSDVRTAAEQSDFVVLESNHDINMLQVGPYPYYLIQRILGKRGHLSNELSGKLLSQLMHDNLKAVCLGHLSRENNLVELAYETVRLEISMSDNPYKPDDFPIFVANRSELSQMVEI